MFGEDTFTLDSVVDQKFILAKVDKRKYYDSYLLAARWTWKDIFKNTIFSQQSLWQMVKQDEDGLYVDIPKGCKRLFGAAVADRHGNLQNIWNNEQMNIVPKPTETCACSCDGIPNYETQWVKTTKFVFRDANIDYYEYSWIRMLPNGSIEEWNDLPVKQYNTLLGDNDGDYNEDYNDDYLVDTNFTDYTIVRNKSQKLLCQLKVKQCGCPENTQENKDLLEKHCNCYKHVWNRNENVIYADINSNGKGGVKISQCGTQLRYKPQKHDCRDGKIPTHILVNFQTNGEKCGGFVEVPEYAVFAMWAGMDYMLADLKEKLLTKSLYEDQCTGIIKYLNTISLTNWAKIQDIKVRW